MGFPFRYWPALLLLLSGCVSPVSDNPAPAPDIPTVHRTRILLVGDVMQHLTQLNAARTPDGSYDYTECFRHVKPLFDSADLVIANLETTITYTGRYRGYPMFASPPELVYALREAGVDVAVTANNHSCDRGATGIRHTLMALDSAGILHTGTQGDTLASGSSAPLCLESGGIRIALLSYTEWTNGLPVPKGTHVNLIDTTRIARDLASLAPRNPDCIIVYYHWGEEYRRYPSRAQRELAEWTHRHGADLVVGSHPHVIQPFEAILRADSSLCGATFYSLGNFVSNQRERHTDGGVAVWVEIERRDSLPITYRFSHQLTWVHTPWREGHVRHTILPGSVADTLLREHPEAWRLQRFLTDSRQLLSGDTLHFREIR